ncbi:PqqD family protein [Neomicrococcus aestuarii]|uniref:PqqD family protein n=1 Tax=Neomicrococcus aestuarii TaxID=556325 RepID=A0A1L2ZN54_9MICC|nr:PqqD family protein [Neomicrococcus aestuarii]APF40458.1 hypothetical protein BHE16_04850 [Neomicrococcus aestuarii]
MTEQVFRISNDCCFEWFVNARLMDAVVCSRPGEVEVVLIETSASIWGAVTHEFESLESISASVAQEYAVNPDEINEEVQSILESLCNLGLIESGEKH